MYTDEDLRSAVQAGLLSEQAASAFRLHVAQRRHAPAVDEEYFRLVSGFNDIFVTIACALMLVSVHWIGASLAPWAGTIAMVAVAWILSEFFIRRRRMALPAIVLLLSGTGAAFGFGIVLLESVLLSGLLAILFAFAHWRRFKVPITVAAGAAVAIACAIQGLVGLPGVKPYISLVFFAAGLVVFLVALRWDASDVGRETRRSDVAFWLHLLAAPLLVHSVFDGIGLFDGQPGPSRIVVVFLLYLVLTLLSLAIDRRALMVSALAYVLYAFAALLKVLGVVDLGFSITAFCIGAALLSLSAFWQPCRAFILRRLPTQLRERMAPLQ